MHLGMKLYDMSKKQFNPFEKEQRLREESTRWGTDDVSDAQEGDIPIIDVSNYFLTGSPESLATVAEKLRIACEEVGFFSIIGHQISSKQMSRTFDTVAKFHALPLASKRSILMDKPDWPVGGVGYLPVKNKKLPARNNGNLNEAFLIKYDHQLSFEDNQWPTNKELPEFRRIVIEYAEAVEKLGKQLLPIYAAALGMPVDFFDKAFELPMVRLRMTHYPPVNNIDTEKGSFGIAPHVDTTFCTLLAQDQPGLTIYSERKQQWINAPLIQDAFIVNSGELLKQWTNDRFLSTKHFANNNASNESRYSIPFFLNANTNFVMSCIPSCCGPDNPAKYPAISYAQSQAMAQGE